MITQKPNDPLTDKTNQHVIYYANFLSIKIWIAIKVGGRGHSFYKRMCQVVFYYKGFLILVQEIFAMLKNNSQPS